MVEPNTDNNNIPNSSDDHEDVQDICDDLDANTWVASGEMSSLPTSIFKDNTLSQYNRKFLLQSEPRNRDISFEPPIMNRKLWTGMSHFAKENDRNLRHVAYHVS